MSIFFSPFPQVDYKVDGKTVLSTNIMLRFRIREVVLKYTDIMFEYVIKDGEKPFIVADKYYGRADLSELILMANSILDPYYSWPMSHREFTEFIKKKYGGIEYATQNIQSYWRIFQPRTMRGDGTFIEERLIRVDKATYETLIEEERKKVTFYDYEYDLNESRRTISLIKKHYIPQIEEELKNILK